MRPKYTRNGTNLADTTTGSRTMFLVFLTTEQTSVGPRTISHLPIPARANLPHNPHIHTGRDPTR